MWDVIVIRHIISDVSKEAVQSFERKTLPNNTVSLLMSLPLPPPLPHPIYMVSVAY
jgi:hypothetical protein